MSMDNRIIVVHEKDRKTLLEDLSAESLGKTVRFLVDDKRPEKELLADLIYEDFVRSR